ncbi:hypothetical protein WR25_23206 [Diploscapter pachys]|uniref:Uncharacterized protein n=1 Tax=Diploscapter pachys TaxID=2018661 RepID=A0A2A2KBU8_9BILA|nr:hypothetical protein WR25_23206 [Diploscapter pachys]
MSARRHHGPIGDPDPPHRPPPPREQPAHIGAGRRLVGKAAHQFAPLRPDPPPARLDHHPPEQIPIRRHPPAPTHVARGIDGDEINGRERQLVHADESRRRRQPCPTDFLSQ